MRIWNKIVLLSTLAVTATPFAAFAADPRDAVGPGETLTLYKIVNLITDVINVFLGLCLTVAIAMLVYAGFIIATARENPKKVEEGQKTLKNAIIGLVVILGVGIIVRTIGDFAVRPTSILR